jgi:hypothetical protein
MSTTIFSSAAAGAWLNANNAELTITNLNMRLPKTSRSVPQKSFAAKIWAALDMDQRSRGHGILQG